jgi:hypothetical protein
MRWATLILLCMFFSTCSRASLPAPAVTASPGGIQVTPVAEYQPDADCAARVRAMREKGDPAKTLPERYRDLVLIDAHNHGAAGSPVLTVQLHQKYFVDRTVLFGNISEPNALYSDNLAFLMYAQQPRAVYPFFAGIPLEEQRG